MTAILLICCSLLGWTGCKNTHSEDAKPVAPEVNVSDIRTGAERTEAYIGLLEGKRVGLVVNQTSQINGVLLPDTLISHGINVAKIFAPEHGFRGDAAEGALVKDGIDVKTGVPILSIYGKKKKPAESDLSGLDIIVFDIQDVGARFYTYISTMHYVMEAAAENGIPFMVLDRPNPNGFYVDGPILNPEQSSFVGMHQVPIVHGMTIGEYAQMINGEGWLDNEVKCELTVIKCSDYSHTDKYVLPVNPSPNLRTMRSIYLYPSICLFEGTQVSVGRGTEHPFEQFGSPYGMFYSYVFVPKRSGSYTPLFADKECFGQNLTIMPVDSIANGKLNLSYLLGMYDVFSEKDNFFRKDGFFNLLAGSTQLRTQIEAGLKEDEIRLSWQEGLIRFKEIRKKYLLYPDFE